ncbi:shufflon protein B [Salmonella enterica subsp. enterica serovar Indiana str. ATCC 51959]|nr:shufflon protein B [Salmonella enterica subsp. enterica serovar Indiana str. ATCC 51959]
MHSNILISYIFTDVKCLNIKVQPIRTPNTGLARLPQCQSGIWQDIKFSFKIGGIFQIWPGQTVNLGRFKLCINTYRIDGREMALTELIPTDTPDSNGLMNWRAMNATQYSSYYMGIHCFI